MHPTRSHVPEGIIPGEPTWDVAQLFPTQGTGANATTLPQHQPLGGVLTRIRRIPAHANHYSSTDSEVSVQRLADVRERGRILAKFSSWACAFDSGQGNTASPMSCSCERNTPTESPTITGREPTW